MLTIPRSGEVFLARYDGTMGAGRFQFTTGRMLNATAWFAVTMALLAYIWRYAGEPSQITVLLVVAGISAAACAIPGASAGRTIPWAVTGMIFGPALLGTIYIYAALLTAPSP
jgi:hypothetical protein